MTSDGPDETVRRAVVLPAALLAMVTMVLWSLFFKATFAYWFYWDDLHLIRPYSPAEIASTFYGPHDPDRIETAALRPICALIFYFQWMLFGENVVLHRLFMAVLMGSLLWLVGLLLCETGFRFRHVVAVVVLFACSRVFAALMLWLTLGSLILSYLFLTTTALFYLRWVRWGKTMSLALTIVFTGLAIGTREEGYTLPVMLPLLWLISSGSTKNRWRASTGVFCVTAVLVVHFVMRMVFVPDAPRIRLFSVAALAQILQTVESAWVPGGEAHGWVDGLLRLLWIGFLGVLMLTFARIGSNRQIARFCGICLLGAILCAPALVVSRSFGVALPTLAFFSGITVAIFEVYRQVSLMPVPVVVWWRAAVASALAFGFVIGLVGGGRRSIYVAESLHKNSVSTVRRNAAFLFGQLGVVTIPAERRQEGLARLAVVGIHTVSDLDPLLRTIRDNPSLLTDNRKSKSALFLEKYDYLSF